MNIVVSKQLRDFVKNNKKNVPILLGILAAIAFVGAITWALWPKTLMAKVDTIGWYYVVQLQEKTIVHGSEWGKPWNKEVVSGSLQCERKYYGMEDCHCHTDYDYTGYGKNRHRTSHRVCSRCPSYRDWCNYDHVTWPKTKEWSSSGDSFGVNWPDYPPPTVNQRIVKNEYYNVIFVDPKGNEKYTLHPASLNQFKRFALGGRWTIKVFVNNSVEIVE